MLKKQHGDKLVKRGDSWYLRGEPPAPGQGAPLADEDGTPLQFVAWFMSEEHCYDEDCCLAGMVRE